MHYQHNPEMTEKAKKLRKEMTLPERILWYQYLRTYPIRFLRQKVIDDYVVDFYCRSAKLVVEVDGAFHGNELQSEHDLLRTKQLEKRGLKVIRIPAVYILKSPDMVFDSIDREVKERINLVNK